MKFLNKTSLTVALIFLLQTSASGTADKWSKQILPHEQPTAEDWVPIRNGKMISFERDLVPAAQQQYQFFAEPLNNNRFSHLGQPQSNTSPFQFFNNPPQQSPAKTRTIQNFGGPFGKLPVAEALVQNPHQNQFQFMQEIRNSPNVVHFQSQPVPKSLQGFPPQQQQLNFPSRPVSAPQFQKIPPPQFQPVQTPPPNFQPIPQQNEQPPAVQGPQTDANGDPVQLLYVPFDSLYGQQNAQRHAGVDARFNILNQPVSAALINDFYSQNEVQELQSKPIQTTRRPTSAPATSLKTTNPFESHLKPKPHQPPLSMFVKLAGGRATETEVLKELQNSNTIDVMDTYTKNSPNVFIGPSGMDAPEGYTKFELPYLSNIESTRSERKIEQLPFFVAPLSYKTPPGFSKIPLPAPHVGSVVVNQPNSLDTEVAGVTQDNYFTKKPTTVQQFGTTDQKQRVVSLNSGFKLSSNGNVELIRNEFTFPTLQPSRPSPTFDSQRSAFTTPRPSFSPSTAETPLTKVAYKEIEEKRNYGHSTLTNPSTTRAPVTQRTKSENYYASSPRSTATRPPKTTPFTELKNVQEEYFTYDDSKRPISQFSFGTEVQNPTHNFDFRPIPNFNFGEVDFSTTKKPKSKATTSHFNFPSSTSAPSPSPSFSYKPTVSVIENTDAFGNVNGGSDGNFFEFRSTNRPTQDYSNANRFNFGTEKTYTQPPQYTFDNNKNNNENTVDDSIVTTDNPNYSLPSDLPEISPQLPGWINSLMDDKWMHESNLTESSTTPAVTTTTTTTRRPNRGSRRPVSTSARSTESPSTSGERSRTATARRRPTTFPARNSVSPTEASTPSRVTFGSRGSKVRFNGTSDDKTKFRTRGRGGSKGTEEDNIEYQRDVLNQNYPSSIRPLGVEPVTERLVEINHDAYKVETAEVAAESPTINDYNTPLENVEVIPLGGNAKNNYQNSFNDNTPDHSPLYYENTIDTTSPATTTTTTKLPSTTSLPPPSPPPSFPSNHKYSFDRDQEQQSAVGKRLKNVATANKLRGNFNYNKNRNTDSFYNTRDSSTTTQPSDNEDDETLITASTTQAPVTTSTTSATTVETTQSTVPRRTSFPRRRLTYTTTEASPSDDSVR